MSGAQTNASQMYCAVPGLELAITEPDGFNPVLPVGSEQISGQTAVSWQEWRVGDKTGIFQRFAERTQIVCCSTQSMNQ